MHVEGTPEIVGCHICAEVVRSAFRGCRVMVAMVSDSSDDSLGNIVGNINQRDRGTGSVRLHVD